MQPWSAITVNICHNGGSSMIANKHITKIIAVIMAAACCLCLTAIIFADELTDMSAGLGLTTEYESQLFGTETPISINIIMDEADWEDMLTNATAEIGRASCRERV